MILRVLNGIVGLVFLLGLVVQYNDPDPIVWMLVYGAAGVACALAAASRPNVALTAATGLVALVWAIVLVPRVLGQVELGSLFAEAGMATLEIEEAREALGLFIIAAWMSVVLVTTRHRKRV